MKLIEVENSSTGECLAMAALQKLSTMDDYDDRIGLTWFYTEHLSESTCKKETMFLSYTTAETLHCGVSVLQAAIIKLSVFLKQNLTA